MNEKVRQNAEKALQCYTPYTYFEGYGTSQMKGMFNRGYKQAIEDIAKMNCFSCKNERCWNSGTEVKMPIEEMIKCWKGE